MYDFGGDTAARDLYRHILSDPHHYVESKIVIDGTHEFGVDGMQNAANSQLSLYETMSAGNCVSATFNASLHLGNYVPPRMASVRPYVRVITTENGQEIHSAWIPKGEFFIDTRAKNYADSVDDEVTDLECFDAMLKLEQPMIRVGETAYGWPKTVTEVMQLISQRTGISLDSRNNLINSFFVPFPNVSAYTTEDADVVETSLTMRKVAGYIAAMHGANWVISNEGKLLLVPLTPHTAVSELGLAMQNLDISSPFNVIHKVTFYYEGVDTVSKQSQNYDPTTDREMSIECPWATQAVADYVYSQIGGYIYRPYSATTAYIDHTVEIGDMITINDVISYVGKMDTFFDSLCPCDIAAPGELEIDHEFPYALSGVTNAMRQSLERMFSSGITVGLNTIDIRVETTMGQGGTVASIQLRVGEGPWQEKGEILLDGNVNISGQLSADALYAVLGDIAQLTVDSLSTSRRIPLYFRDENYNSGRAEKEYSEDNFIRIADQTYEWITASVDIDSQTGLALTEQARNPNGELIYWESDISNAEISAATGWYPYKNGSRVFTQTAQTQWPVMVYQYSELTKGKLTFEADQDTGHYEPLIVLGAGDEQGRSKAYIRKGVDGLHMDYQTNHNGTPALHYTNDGYLDIVGQRRTLGLDCTGWPEAGQSGTIYETLEGLEDPIEYGVSVAADESSVTFTYEDGTQFVVALPSD